MVKSSHTIGMTLEELKPLIIAKARDAISESGITEPNALLQEQSFLDLHWKDPVLVLEGEPEVQLESREGDPVVVLLLQRVRLEAEKTEAKGRTALWPLSEAGQQQTVDRHAALVSGSLHIHCRCELPAVPTRLKDVRVVLHIMSNPADLQPETDMGSAVPVPGIRDIIQKAFQSRLTKASKEQKDFKQVEIDAVPEKIKELPEALQQCKITNVQLITKRKPDGILATADLEGDLSLWTPSSSSKSSSTSSSSSSSSKV